MKNKLVIILTVALFVAILVLISANRHSTKQATLFWDSDPSGEVVAHVLPTAKSDDKTTKIVVGAKPSFNAKQEFAPPTNSIAITNQQQLDELLLKGKSRGNQ